MMSLVPMRSSCFCRKRRKARRTARVFIGGRDLAPQLLQHFGPARAAPQGDPQHLQKIGIGDQQIAEELAGAEQLQHRFQRARPAFQQHRQRRRPGAREIALQIVERHVRVGTARQQAGPADGTARSRLEAERRSPAGRDCFCRARCRERPSREELARLLARFQTMAQFVGLHGDFSVGPALAARGVQLGRSVDAVILSQCGKREPVFRLRERS